MSYYNAAMSSLGQGYWECRRVGGRDTGKKENNLSLHTCYEVQPGFCLLPELRTKTKIIIKLKWGQLVA
jgi:hypothetical protein